MRVKIITYMDILWCVQQFTVSSALLCPELYCVQHITVSNTLLCQAKYLPKLTLTQKIFCPPFTLQRAAVVLCACEAPLFSFSKGGVQTPQIPLMGMSSKETSVIKDQ